MLPGKPLGGEHSFPRSQCPSVMSLGAFGGKFEKKVLQLLGPELSLYLTNDEDMIKRDNTAGN